jgi:type VI protein secretion system component Hcp
MFTASSHPCESLESRTLLSANVASHAHVAGHGGHHHGAGVVAKVKHSKVTKSAVAAAATAATGNSLILVKMDGIDGDSVLGNYAKQITASSFSFSVASLAGSHPVRSDVTFGKGVDVATPTIFLDAATGKHITQLLVTVADAATQAARVTYLFSNVVITDDQIGAQAGSAGAGAEAVSFQYDKVVVTVNTFDPATGRAVGAVRSGYDFTMNARA